MTITGAYNFRDLGGLPTQDGRATVPRRLFRSDTLQALTHDDVRTLVDSLGVGGIVDLRSGEESVTEGRGLLGGTDIVYVNVPMRDVQEFSGEPGELLLNHYTRHLHEDENLAVAVDFVLALAHRSSCIVHCAAGKDRTGMVVALVLRLLGVRDDAIVADYLASQASMPQVMSRFADWPRYKASMDALPPEIYAAAATTMEGFLGRLDEAYGGAREWAVLHGVDEHRLEQALSTLLTG